MDDNSINKIIFFNLVVNVYRIDHFFDDSTRTYRTINQLENSLKKHQRTKYHTSIKEKLKYLKLKWEIRQKSYKKSNAKLAKAYLVDDELFISTDKIDYKTSIDKLKKWQEYTECYYELDDWKSNLNKITTEFKHKDYSELSTLELLFLLKDFKDVNKDYESLKEVVLEFEKRFTKHCHTEQRFLYNKTYLYSLNNQFSLLLEQTDVDEDSISELKSHIEKIQKRCNIDNFFIDSKHIDFRITKLESIFSNREELEDLSKYKEELEGLSKSVTAYKKNLNWSKNNHNLLFQLPYKECLVESNISDLDIFYASSIVLPLPHEESQDHYESINSRLRELKQLVLSVVSLNKEFSTIRGLQANQIKTLETIGVFTAITAFILASIPSFSFVKDFYQALLFTGIIGSSLFLMVSMIFLFTRGFKRVPSWILIIVSIILFVFTIFSLRNSVDKIEVEVKTKYLKKIDSVKVIQHKSDSIKILYDKVNSLIKEDSIASIDVEKKPAPLKK